MKVNCLYVFLVIRSNRAFLKSPLGNSLHSNRINSDCILTQADSYPLISDFQDRGGTVVNLLAPELFFFILAHPVYKM